MGFPFLLDLISLNNASVSYSQLLRKDKTRGSHMKLNSSWMHVAEAFVHQERLR